MVVPSQTAAPLNQSALSSSMVDAQMAGRPVQQALSDNLTQNGYAVYERPWGDFAGDFVRVAQSQVG